MGRLRLAGRRRAESPLADAGLAQLLPLRHVRYGLGLFGEAFQVVGRALVVFEAEGEPAQWVRAALGVQQDHPALVLERAVVNLTVEQVDLVAGRPALMVRASVPCFSWPSQNSRSPLRWY